MVSLSQPPKCWDYRHALHLPVSVQLLIHTNTLRINRFQDVIVSAEIFKQKLWSLMMHIDRIAHREGDQNQINPLLVPWFLIAVVHLIFSFWKVRGEPTRHSRHYRLINNKCAHSACGWKAVLCVHSFEGIILDRPLRLWSRHRVAGDWESAGWGVGISTKALGSAREAFHPCVPQRSLMVKRNKHYTTNPYWGFCLRGITFFNLLFAVWILRKALWAFIVAGVNR